MDCGLWPYFTKRDLFVTFWSTNACKTTHIRESTTGTYPPPEPSDFHTELGLHRISRALYLLCLFLPLLRSFLGTTLACGILSEILCVASKLWCLHLTMLRKRVAYPTRTFTRNWLTTLNTAYSIIYCWRPCQEKNLEIISYWSLILKKIFMVEEVLPFQVLFKLCSWILESCDIHVAHFALDHFLLHIWIRSCGDKRKFSIFSL